MRILVFGAGYVGLVTGTCLADLGHNVTIYDVDKAKTDALSDGVIPIYEPGLGELVKRNAAAGRLRFLSEYPEATSVDAYFIAVGTPPASDGSADLTAVMSVADAIKFSAKKRAVVVVKSTVPVGTCDAVQARFVEAGARLEVVSNPEFLKEGDAVADFFKPDRVVVGVSSTWAEKVMRELYAPLNLSGERPLIVTDPRSSELIKYASNTMLAMRISFMNELSRLCHKTEANIHDVRLGVGADTRIGKKFLYAGPGYGGSCFPKDVAALAALGRTYGLPMRMAEAAQRANDEQAQFLAELIEGSLGKLSGKRIALWGLAFKPETDDVREAPSVKLSKYLLERGALVIGHDPEAGANFDASMRGAVQIADKQYDALDGAHALVLLTEWRCYRTPNFAEVRKQMSRSGRRDPLIVDARNIWSPKDVTDAELRYRGVGVSYREAC